MSDRYEEICARARKLSRALRALRAKERELSKEFDALIREKWAIEAQRIEPTRTRRGSRSSRLQAILSLLDRGEISKEEAQKKIAALLS